MTQKHADATYAAADYMDDPQLKAKGKELVKHYGCAGCHEIAGLEDEGRIGTELTNEGSKPIERLDFALYTEDAKRGILPDGKPSSARPPGTIPRVSSRTSSAIPPSSIRASTTPIRWTPAHAQAQSVNPRTIATPWSPSCSAAPILLCRPNTCTSPPIAAQCHSRRLVDRHEIQLHRLPPDRIGQRSVLMDLPMYQGENKSNLPPVLTSEGARVNPEWLKRFLANPVAEHHGHQSQRRPQLSAGAHAHVLSFRRRNPQAGSVLRSHVVVSPSRSFRPKSRAAHRRRSAPWPAIFSPAPPRRA